MVEVTLITPSAQVQTVGAGGQQAQSATQTGQLATPHLSPGALVAGIITGNDGGGGYLLKTDVGTLTLHSSVPLTYNSDVLIRVDSSNGSNAAARIITVNGEAFASYSAPVQTEGDSVSPALLAKADTTSTQASSVTADATQPAIKPVAIPAVTVPTPVSSGPTPAAATPPSPEAPVPTGTNVVLYVAPPPANASALATHATPAEVPSPQAPTSTENTTPTTTTVTTLAEPDAGNIAVTTQPPPATPAIPDTVARLLVPQPQALKEPFSQPASFFSSAPQAQAAPAQSPAMQTTQYAAYAKSAPLPPSAVTAATTAIPAPPTVLVEAQVAIQHPDGPLTLTTPQGIITVQPENFPANVPLQAGTPVTLALPAQALATTQEAASTSKSLWEPLPQILTVLQEKMPSVASDVLSRLPTIGENFLSSSIFFLSTLLQGNAKKLLGGAALEVLKDAGATDLVDSFSAHVHTTAQAFTSTKESITMQQWQGMVLPFVYQGEVQEARLYVKREPPRKNKEQKKSSSDTRFIIEVDFSDLGALQLDGLVLPKASNTVFDLVVRTHTAFTAEDRTELTHIYNNAAELTGFRGSISFQVSRQFPVNPLAEMAAPPISDIIA